MKAEEKVTKAKIQLLSEHPFFGYLLIYTKTIFDEKVLTGGTDGKAIYVNPRYIEKLSVDEVKALLAHEVLHCALLHLWRRGNREPMVWNIATDLAVNSILVDNYFKLPTGSLYDKRYHGYCAEEIYEKIKDRVTVIEVPAPGTPGKRVKVVEIDGREIGRQMDEHMEGGRDGKDEARRLAEEWCKRLAEAYEYARQHGRLPAGIEKILDIVLKPPKVNWKQFIEHEIITAKSKDYTWLRPSKATLAGVTDYWLPGIEKEKEVDLVVAIDTSNSIMDEEYAEFVNEVYNMVKKHNVRATVLLCDYDIQAVYKELKSPMEIIEKLKKRKGYGGTSFKPVFQWVEKNVRNCKLLIYFTDSYGEYPEKKPKYNVIWVVPKSVKEVNKPPFGKLVRM